jgi:hypothetical protein
MTGGPPFIGTPYNEIEHAILLWPNLKWFLNQRVISAATDTSSLEWTDWTRLARSALLVICIEVFAPEKPNFFYQDER